MIKIAKESPSRRHEILDAAQRLIFTKGYEQMTIQDILDTLQISKGAFYHYFSSKQALMEALIERMGDQAAPVIIPILEDPDLPALEKLERFFTASAQWKSSYREVLLGLMSAWYSDENALVRQKMQAATLASYTPMIARVLRQGAQEGVIQAPFPEQNAEVFMCLVAGLGDSLSQLMLTSEPGEATFHQMQTTSAAFTSALERVLGAPAGSLKLVNPELLKEWVVSPP
jgi:AcrR family transcriptional regulator